MRDPDSGRNTVASRRRLLYGWYIESQPPACHHNSVSGQGKANLINAPAVLDDDLFLSRPLADQHICSVPCHKPWITFVDYYQAPSAVTL